MGAWSLSVSSEYWRAFSLITGGEGREGGRNPFTVSVILELAPSSEELHVGVRTILAYYM